MFLRKAIVLAGVLVIAATFAFVGAADAKKKKKKRTLVFGSNVTLNFTPPGTFKGKVSVPGRAKPDTPKCRDHRTVTLYYYDPTGSPPSVLGIDKTNSDGEYRFDSEPFAFSGTYRLTVEALTIKERGGKVIKCRSAEAPAQSV